jgi:hypothetical protein
MAARTVWFHNTYFESGSKSPWRSLRYFSLSKTNLEHSIHYEVWSSRSVYLDPLG